MCKSGQKAVPGALEKERVERGRWIGACVFSLVLAAISMRFSLWPVRAYYATRVVNTAKNPTAADDHEWIRRLARQSRGDLKQLSQSDRQRLQRITRGHGEMALQVALSEL